MSTLNGSTEKYGIKINSFFQAVLLPRQRQVRHRSRGGGGGSGGVRARKRGGLEAQDNR